MKLPSIYNPNKPLCDQELQRYAPSIFSTEQWVDRSDKYKFIPTIDVIQALRDKGYYPVYAGQSSTRTEGKLDKVKHTIRLRDKRGFDGGGEIPEIVLLNSHDGTSAYRMMLGIFRTVCCNGLIVSDKTIDSISLIHRGKGHICDDVIDIAGKVIEMGEIKLKTVDEWKRIELRPEDRDGYAQKAIDEHGTDIKVIPSTVLRARRHADRAEERTLWGTYNIVQENLMKGYCYGVDSKGKYRKLRAIKSVDRGLAINRYLWSIADELAELRGDGLAVEDAQVVESPGTSYTRAKELILRYGARWTDHVNELKG